jgi:hypothetical protein
MLRKRRKLYPDFDNLTSAEGNITSAEGNITSAEGNITSAEGTVKRAEGDHDLCNPHFLGIVASLYAM